MSAYSLPKDDDAFQKFQPPTKRGSPLPLPDFSEIEITRHFSHLAKRSVGIDNIFYPLGSCTMKLNPRVNEAAAALPGFSRTHPLAPPETVRGNLQLIDDLLQKLCHICGMEAGSLRPNAGAQGELVGILMIRNYHHDRGETERDEIIIPDSAHGTNPATAQMAGFKTRPVPTDETGEIDLEALREAVSHKTAGLMLTNPNTLGLFSHRIQEIAEIIHEVGGLLYYDGANLNAILNIAKPGDMGFDVMHLNLHKTFSTPHGGGGPGSGPVLCSKKLEKYLHIPISTFHGTFGVYLRAYLYILLHGNYGLRKVSEAAVIHANYLKHQLSKSYNIPYERPCMHEFVAQPKTHTARDIAKRLLDYNIHAPTIYFPLIVKECLLIEPTETETRETLDEFVQALEEIAKEPAATLSQAPHTTPVRRLDEVQAARNPLLSQIW